MPMGADFVVRIVSVTTASAVLLAGLVVLFNLFVPAPIPSNLRVILGSMMTLYGTYRLFFIWRKTRKGAE